MPYDAIGDLPDQVTDHLPEGAQTIYRKAFNAAWKEYSQQDGREETAHRVAWSAVKERYVKDEAGQWVRKDY